MRRLKALLRLLAVVLLTLLSAGTILLSRPLRHFADDWQRRIRNAVFRLWARGLTQAMGMRVEVEGTPPQGAFFLVANHVSYMDIILLATQLDAAFVAKADLESWPALGRIFGVADTIFIDRGRRKDIVRVRERLEHQLGRQLGIVLFPEGTSGKGDTVLRFKPSLLELPAERSLPVHYAAISYVSPEGWPPAHEAICWWGDAPFLPHVSQLLELPYFEARLSFGAEPIHDPDRKNLAERLHAQVSSRFTPIL